MFHREVPYKRFAFIAAVLLVLLALYQAFNIALIPFSMDGGAHSGPLILVNFPEAGAEMLGAGVLTPLAVAVLLFGIASLRVTVTYWCVQAALWLAAISFWYQSRGANANDLGHTQSSWLWLALAAGCSLILLVGYKLVLRALARYLNETSR